MYVIIVLLSIKRYSVIEIMSIYFNEAYFSIYLVSEAIISH